MEGTGTLKSAQFVKIHQNLLNIIIGTKGLLAATPFTAPIGAVLQVIEGGVDRLANFIIGLVPGCADQTKKDLAALDGTLDESIRVYICKEDKDGNVSGPARCKKEPKPKPSEKPPQPEPEEPPKSKEPPEPKEPPKPKQPPKPSPEPPATYETSTPEPPATKPPPPPPTVTRPPPPPPPPPQSEPPNTEPPPPPPTTYYRPRPRPSSIPPFQPYSQPPPPPQPDVPYVEEVITTYIYIGNVRTGYTATYIERGSRVTSFPLPPPGTPGRPGSPGSPGNPPTPGYPGYPGDDTFTINPGRVFPNQQGTCTCVCRK